jgi:hypothetical protein
MKTINKEPFIYLKNKKYNSKNQEVIYNQIYRHKAKYSFFEDALDYIYANNIIGDYFEFGVHKARTFRFFLDIANKKNLKMNCYAFDSFKGFPDYKTNLEENINWKPNLLQTNKNLFKKLVKDYLNDRKLKMIEGYYHDSLNKNLIKDFKKQNIKTSFINLDCDLVKSIEDSLNFSLNFITEGTILYVDEYYVSYRGNPKKGIPLLLEKIFKKKKINNVKWKSVGSFGQSFLLFK